jgi:hypothetical protein
MYTRWNSLWMLRVAVMCGSLIICASFAGAVHAQLPNMRYTSGTPGFVPNAGQVRGDGLITDTVRFVLRLGRARVCFRDRGFSYVAPVAGSDTAAAPSSASVSLANRSKSTSGGVMLGRVDCNFAATAVHSGAASNLGSAPNASICGRGLRKETQTYYVSGSEYDDLPVYDSLVYTNVYPGIDVCFRVEAGRLKYDFLVSAGADARAIALSFPQCSSLKLDSTGAMIITHRFGTLIDDAPTILMREPSGITSAPAIRFAQRDAHTFGFELPASYNSTQALVIDPAITWATFFGGRIDDEVTDAVINNVGLLVVCGWSLSDVFPGTSTLNAGDEDVFIARFNADRTLNTTTYFGGPKLDIANGIAVDNQDNVFITGQSMSGDLGFAKNVFQWANSNPVFYNDAIVVKFNNRLKYVSGTFIGGGNEDIALDVATDAQDNVIVVGNTYSDNYPATLTGLYTTRRGTPGDVDICMSKWNNSLECLWSTYYGGRAVESATSCATDSSANIYVGGWTHSMDFPNLSGFQRTRSGDGDGFLIKLTAQGFPLGSTLFGGGGDENIYDIEVTRGLVCATGFTSSGNDLPSFGKKQAQDKAGGLSDGFVLVTDTDLEFRWSTYWGGYGPEVFYAVNVTTDTGVVVTGYTGSPDMPLKRSIQLPHADGIEDIVVAKFTATGVNTWSTVIGGKGSDVPRAMCLDALDNMYIVGSSSGSDFPVRGAIFPNLNGSKDGIIIKLCPTTPAIKSSTGDTVVCEGGTITLSADPGLSRFRWSTGQSTPSIDVQTAGTYFYSADSPLGCTAFSDTIRIYIKQKSPAVVLAKGKSLPCVGDSVLLYSANRFDAYSWRDASGKEVGNRDSLFVKAPGTYHLNVVDRSGCYDSSKSITVTFSSPPPLGYVFTRNGASAADTVNGEIRVCETDLVTLFAQTRGLPLFWTNGASTPAIDIRSSIRIAAFVTDASGCVWRMDTVSIVFEPRSTLRVNSADTVCIGQTTELRVEGREMNTGFAWNVSGGVISSRVDSGVVRVTWSSPGSKKIEISDSRGLQCLDPGFKDIAVRSGYGGGITSDASAACTAEVVRLRAPAGFSRYTWNDVRGDSVHDAIGFGETRLEFGDDSGCVGRDTLRITNRSNVLCDVSSLNFDTVEVAALRTDSLRCSQQLEDYIAVRAYLLRGTDFVLRSVLPALGTRVAKGLPMSASVDFRPTGSGVLRDTLCIVFQAPCQDSFYIPVQGIGAPQLPNRQLLIRIPDQTLNVLDSEFVLPIQAVVPSLRSAILIDSVWITAEYPAAMMKFASVRSGVEAVETVDIAGDRATLNLRIASVEVRSDTTALTSVRMYCLLGSALQDSLRLTRADVYSASSLTVQSQGALCTWAGVCSEGGNRLIGRGSPLSMSVRPNPAGTIAEVLLRSQEKGWYTIAVHDVYGRCLAREQKSMAAFADQTIAFDVSAFAEGAYTISVLGPFAHLSVPLMVYRGGH